MNDTIIPPMPKRSDYVDNPFGNDVARVQTLGALANAEQQRAIAEVQARMMIARANPRDPIRAMDLILRDCTRPSLAKGGLYAYPKGGSTIEGPSIRLAEAMAQRWGNIASGIKEVSRANGYSECVAYAWDLETGYYDERQFQIRHWIDLRSGGGRATTDEREIYELVANLGQRRKRAVLLTVMPGDVQEAAVEQCKATLAADADTSPEALKRLVEAFKGFGVSQALIEKRCLCRLEALRPAQILQLSTVYASLRDEMSAPGDWFDTGGAWSEIAARHAEAAATQPAGDRKPRAPKAAKTDPERVERQVAEMQQAKAQPQQQTAPATTTAATPAGFAAWLVDGDGDVLAADDGEGSMYDDPVAFARALANVKADTFPADWAPIEAANREDMDRAYLASEEAAAILRAMREPAKEITQEAPSEAITGAEKAAEEISQRVATGVPVSSDLLGPPAPLDMLMVRAPDSPTKQNMERYAESAKLILYSITRPDGIEAFEAKNAPIYTSFPNKWRVTILGLIADRKKELSPPPSRVDPPTPEQRARQIHDQVMGDIRLSETLAQIDMVGRSTVKLCNELGGLNADLLRAVQTEFRTRYLALGGKLTPRPTA